MDFLSSYGEKSSANDQMSKNRLVSTSGFLQSEWENFEKSLEYPSPPNSSNEPISQSSRFESSNSPKIESSNSPKIESSNSPQTNMNKLPLTKDVVLKNDEEEDESHLPPGVRKKNRCHSSSSSSEDERAKDKVKNDSDSDSSSDESDASPARSGEKKADARDKEVRRSREVTPKGSSKKAKPSRSSSESRSRSRSPHRKRRKSDDHRSRRSRSRSTSRHRRTDRKHESRRSRSKDRRRSKERDYRHRRRERKYSRSRERRRSYGDQRSSHRRRERSWSRDRSRSRDSSRSRDRRNRSPSPRGGKVIKFGDKVIKAGASFGRPPPSKPMTFKEKMRQQFIKTMEEGGDVSQAFSPKGGSMLCLQTAGIQQIPVPKKPPVPLMANLVSCPAGLAPATITAAEAAVQSLLALQKETTEKTGVEIPKFYNPAAINPVKYAEQVQKRKLLWSKTKEKGSSIGQKKNRTTAPYTAASSSKNSFGSKASQVHPESKYGYQRNLGKEVNSQWHATTLSNDHDDKSKEKFRKLMGIKSESSGEDGDKASEELELKQKELFEKLDKEYQYARMATHTHRGVGLGFGSSSFQAPNS